MEVTLQVAVAPKPGETVKEDDVMMTCQFVMVSLDPTTRKATKLPATLAETKDEKALYAAGEKNSQLRKDRLKASLLRQAPNHEEGELIHAIWKKTIQWHDPNDPERKPDNVHFMDTTKISTTSVMQPQYRNRHHFMIFGGYLLKQTFELAFCCAAAFTHARPTFVALDPSTFENPVPVGSVLYCTATVAYTDPPVLERGSDSIKGTSLTRIQVRIDTKVRNVEHGETKPTGQFNYTFTVDKDIKVVPRTYSEFMMWTNGRRRAQDVEKSLERGDADGGSTERITE
ncbi:hypothetical protein AMS68_002486 [Peltaster fructicola]|uniref:HotDog ACOT-type domain-containing protein n=1 Tax=Peltaster fructicola TaxID=286661 RepID=A0A6H0XQS1_9PEZI|nr:hypothetical protein AMS68_002486 [Peltaster fructicola]